MAFSKVKSEFGVSVARLLWLSVILVGCSDVGFVGNNPAAAIEVNGSGDQFTSSGPNCEIQSGLHPSVDSMMFRVKVFDPLLRLDIAGRYDGAPKSTSQGLMFSDVTLPVDDQNKVSVGVFRHDDGAAVGLSPSTVMTCEAQLFDLEFAASGTPQLEGQEGLEESVDIQLKWSNLFPGETMRFVDQQSVFSQDLQVQCRESGSPVAIADPDKSGDKIELNEVVFLCTIKYIRPYSVKSVRYKNQKTLWQFLRDGIPVTSIERSVTLDLIASNPAQPSQNEPPQGEAPLGVPPLLDPESCAPMIGPAGQPFSHVCDSRQSLLGNAATGTVQACGAPAQCGN